MLEVKDLEVYYGAIHAVKGISLRVEDGQIVTLIGSNGAGKSTTLHTISGLIKPRSGNILFDGTDITGTPAAKMLMLTLMAARASKVFFIRVFSVICFFIDGFPLYCYCRAAALEGAAADSCFIANRRPAMASSRLSLAIFVRRAFTRSFVSLRAPSSFVL